ncbi:MAG: hypothetical protein ACPGSO_00225 [Vicingaceae bacterium]
MSKTLLNTDFYKMPSNLPFKDLRFLSVVLCLLCFAFSSCSNDVPEQLEKSPAKDTLVVNNFVAKGDVKIVEPIKDETVVVLKKDGITLTEIKPEQPEVSFNLNTKKFEVGKNQLSFSIDGVQHYNIAYLANNYAVSQFNTTNFEVEFLYGNNVFLAFLTDKNYVSIKTNKGSVLKNVVLGGAESLFDMDQPHLFYYLPQGKTIDPILDFYLTNTSISENGNNIKVTINKTEFTLNKWAAYKISGLKQSENTARIQLLDKNNQLIEGPFNDSGERNFVLENLKP